MSGPYAPPKNDPFKGGSLQRLNPPSGGTFGIPPPSGGGGGSLAGNAAGGGPFFARNNRGSNVSIPYARVVSFETFEEKRMGCFSASSHSVLLYRIPYALAFRYRFITPGSPVAVARSVQKMLAM